MDLGSTQQSRLASCLSFPYQKLGRAMLSKKILKMDWSILVSFVQHVNVKYYFHLIQLSTSRLKNKREIQIFSYDKPLEGGVDSMLSCFVPECFLEREIFLENSMYKEKQSLLQEKPVENI